MCPISSQLSGRLIDRMARCDCASGSVYVDVLVFVCVCSRTDANGDRRERESLYECVGVF